MPQYIYRIIYFTNYVTCKIFINVPICLQYIYIYNSLPDFLPFVYKYIISKITVKIVAHFIRLHTVYSYVDFLALIITERSFWASGALLSILFLKTERSTASLLD